MKKQTKKSAPRTVTAQQQNVGKKLPEVPDLGDKEFDTDELVHENRDEKPIEFEEFDADEVVHSTNSKVSIPTGSEKDIDDLVHENTRKEDETDFPKRSSGEG